MEEWIRVELEKVCSKVGSNYQPKESSNLPYVGLEHIESKKSMLTNHGFESEIKSSKTRFKKGQILYGKLRPYLDKAVIAPFDGICSTDILVFDSNTESMNEFLIHLIHSNGFIDHAKATTNGVQHPRTSWNSLKQFNFLLPSLPEQRKIAHVLSMVQKAIEQQDKIIRTTTELKKALMQKLFTEGTRGEPQKETEIGLVPESWEVVELGKCLLKTQYGISAKGNEKGNVPILRMTNQKDGYISGDNLQYVNISEKELNKFKVNMDDVIFNRTNSFELVGRTAIFKLTDDYIFASYLIRLVTNSEKLYPEFLNFYLNADDTQKRLKSIATRGVSQSNISASRLSGFFIPLPSLTEQKEIISTINVFNVKINCNDKKKQTLTDLFKTLLHELMTGQRRVHELEFDEMMKGI